MAFKADLSGAITVALLNVGPVGSIGPLVDITIPAGSWQVRTDGIVLFSLGGSGLNVDLADTIFPEMAQFIIASNITTVLTLALQSLGNARVTFYPEFVGSTRV